jgi:hypothetical protein
VVPPKARLRPAASRLAWPARFRALVLRETNELRVMIW